MRTPPSELANHSRAFQAISTAVGEVRRYVGGHPRDQMFPYDTFPEKYAKLDQILAEERMKWSADLAR